MLKVIESKFENQVLTDMLNSFDNDDAQFKVIQVEYKYHSNNTSDKANSPSCTILYDDDKPLLFAHTDYTYNVTDQGNEFLQSFFVMMSNDKLDIEDALDIENVAEIYLMSLVGALDEFYSVMVDNILEDGYFMSEADYCSLKSYNKVSIHDCYGLNFDGKHWGYMLDSGCVQDLNQTEGWQENLDNNIAL